MSLERLQKIIAAAGLASRRKAEQLISSGLVSVNGEIVSQLGAKADPERDHIRVGGKLLRGPQRHVYFLLNKPRGYVTTVTDPEGRPTVMELMRAAGARLYPVGRLDYDSEGLLLMTNDGDLTYRLMHAASHVPKTYQVKVSGKPGEAELGKLRAGIFLPARPPKPGQGGGDRSRKSAPARIRLLRDAENPWYEVTLIEGRNRQIRRMFEQIGHHVEKIKRVAYGPLQLDVAPGEFRPLQPAEVARLRALAGAGRGPRSTSR
ncbi:MAG TPA: pseudouridine synthase [Terriglobales bacterium]|nr:pseudouridine synthase [Terriglobales bacterium]